MRVHTPSYTSPPCVTIRRYVSANESATACSIDLGPGHKHLNSELLGRPFFKGEFSTGEYGRGGYVEETRSGAVRCFVCLVCGGCVAVKATVTERK